MTSDRSFGVKTAAHVRIRRARLPDASAMAALRRAAIRGLPAGAHPRADLDAWASLPALYDRWAMTAGGETLLLAEGAGRLVGFAGLRKGDLTALFVRPSSAGLGVGSALVAAVERLARRRGVQRLGVLAAASAAPFYRARGFSGGRATRAPLPGGRALRAVRLVKTLTRLSDD